MDARDLEVRCSGCGAGFAAGTRTCIHCGQRLASGGSSLDPRPLSTEEDEATPEGAQFGRLTNVLYVVLTIGAVVASSVMRSCD